MKLNGEGLSFDYIGRSRSEPEILQRKMVIHLGFQGFGVVKVLIRAGLSCFRNTKRHRINVTRFSISGGAR